MLKFFLSLFCYEILIYISILVFNTWRTVKVLCVIILKSWHTVKDLCVIVLKSSQILTIGMKTRVCTPLLIFIFKPVSSIL